VRFGGGEDRCLRRSCCHCGVEESEDLQEQMAGQLFCPGGVKAVVGGRILGFIALSSRLLFRLPRPLIFSPELILETLASIFVSQSCV
jgi:hypothetical protein